MPAALSELKTWLSQTGVAQFRFGVRHLFILILGIAMGLAVARHVHRPDRFELLGIVLIPVSFWTALALLKRLLKFRSTPNGELSNLILDTVTAVLLIAYVIIESLLLTGHFEPSIRPPFDARMSLLPLSCWMLLIGWMLWRRASLPIRAPMSLSSALLPGGSNRPLMVRIAQYALVAAGVWLLAARFFITTTFPLYLWETFVLDLLFLFVLCAFAATVLVFPERTSRDKSRRRFIWQHHTRPAWTAHLHYLILAVLIFVIAAYDAVTAYWPFLAIYQITLGVPAKVACEMERTDISFATRFLSAAPAIAATALGMTVLIVWAARVTKRLHNRDAMPLWLWMIGPAAMATMTGTVLYLITVALPFASRFLAQGYGRVIDAFNVFIVLVGVAALSAGLAARLARSHKSNGETRSRGHDPMTRGSNVRTQLMWLARLIIACVVIVLAVFSVLPFGRVPLSVFPSPAASGFLAPLAELTRFMGEFVSGLLWEPDFLLLGVTAIVALDLFLAWRKIRELPKDEPAMAAPPSPPPAADAAFWVWWPVLIVVILCSVPTLALAGLACVQGLIELGL